MLWSSCSPDLSFLSPFSPCPLGRVWESSCWLLKEKESASSAFLSECDTKIGRPLPHWSVTVGDIQRTRATNFRICLLAGCDGLDMARFQSRSNGIFPADLSCKLCGDPTTGASRYSWLRNLIGFLKKCVILHFFKETNQISQFCKIISHFSMKLYRELYSYSIKKGKLHPNFLVASSSNLHPLQATSTNSSQSLHEGWHSFSSVQCLQERNCLPGPIIDMKPPVQP